MSEEEILELQSWLKSNTSKIYSKRALLHIKTLTIWNSSVSTLHPLIGKLPKLTSLEVSVTKIKEIDIKSKTLMNLDCSINFELTKIKLECPNLLHIICSKSKLEAIEIKCKKLKSIKLFGNNFKKFDFKHKSVEYIYLNLSNIVDVKLSCPKLKFLDVSENQLVNIKLQTPKMENFVCISNKTNSKINFNLKNNKIKKMYIDAYSITDINKMGLDTLEELGLKMCEHECVSFFENLYEYSLINRNLKAVSFQFKRGSRVVQGTSIYKLLQKFPQSEQYLYLENSNITQLL